MTALLADPTFLDLRWDAWQAIGVWITIGVYIVIAFVALRQLGEARQLRKQQTRPFVIAQIKGRSILVLLAFRNVGTTQARDVVVRLEERLRSAEGSDRDLGWQDRGIFDSGMPTMAPNEEVKFFFDSMPKRQAQGLPMVIRGTISYADLLGNRYADEPFVIDLDVYGPALQADNGIHELVGEVKEVRKELTKWTDGSHGILVNALDHDRNTIRSERPFHFMGARQRLTQDGWKAFANYYAKLWQGRRGWYSR